MLSQTPLLHGLVAPWQAPPAGTAIASQKPVAALHSPFMQPTSSDEQSLGPPPTQLPLMQVSPTMHAAPLAQALPFFMGSGIGLHAPVPGSHVIVLQASNGDGGHGRLGPTHAPAVQVVCVRHRSSETHAAPSSNT